jgi:single-strand DNA-binding protein
MNETYTTVVGTLITQVGRRRLANGTTVVNFRVASNERRFDKATGGWRDGETLYVGVSAWRQLAENIHASFVMGDPIMVRGRLYTRSYEKDGRRQSITELEADAVGPDLARSTAAVTRMAKRVDVPAPDGSSDDSSAAVPVAMMDASGDEQDGWLAGLVEPDADERERAPGARVGAVGSGVEAAVGA